MEFRSLLSLELDLDFKIPVSTAFCGFLLSLLTPEAVGAGLLTGLVPLGEDDESGVGLDTLLLTFLRLGVAAG